jgi:hypothetical protein
MDQSSLAIDDIFARGGNADCGISQEPGPGPLLAVVQRIVEISDPVFSPH